MVRLLKAISLFGLMLLSACAPTMRITPGEIPPPTVPSSELKNEAEYYVQNHLQEQSYREIKSGPELKRISGIVERLSKAAGYPPRTFPVHLADAGEEVNAAAFNGASIVVYKKLADKVKSDDELATVLGHEMGHIIAKHYEEQEEENSRATAVGVGSAVLGTVASVATSVAGYGGLSGVAGDAAATTTGMVGYGAFVGSFSRRQEYEADHIGLLIMAKAGYDPRVAPEFWKRSDEIFGASSSQVGAFFNTHPAETDRQDALEEAMPLAMSHYHPTPAKATSSGGKKKEKAAKDAG